jgi:ferredoxin
VSRAIPQACEHVVKIVVDFDLCQGHGVCVEEAPELFALDAETSKVVVLDESPPEVLRAKLAAAVKYLPTRALRAVDE